MSHEFTENLSFTGYASVLWMMSGLATVLLVVVDKLSLDVSGLPRRSRPTSSPSQLPFFL